MKIRIGLREIYSFIIAFVLTDGFLIEYISKCLGAEIGATVGRVALYIVVILSIIIMILDFSLAKKAILPFGFLMALGLYQTLMFSHPAESSYVRDFVIQGAGGLIVGVSLNDYVGIIKKASIFSFVYGLFLIAEPINGKLLNLYTMSLGYTIIPYVIWMFAAVFICEKKQYWLLVCAIPLALTTILFTSRGCGLSIVVAVLLLYVLSVYARGGKVNLKIVIASISIMLVFIVLSAVFSMGLFSSVEFSEGSAIYKILNGSFSSSNGRAEIWEFGVYTIKRNWITGIGFGNDIVLAKSWFQYYSFVHSIFLDIFLHFGIPIGLFIIILYSRKCILSIRESKDHFFKGFIIAMMFSYVFMLLFSSQYLNHIFHIMIVFGACTIHYAKNKENKTID